MLRIAHGPSVPVQSPVVTKSLYGVSVSVSVGGNPSKNAGKIAGRATGCFPSILGMAAQNQSPPRNNWSYSSSNASTSITGVAHSTPSPDVVSAFVVEPSRGVGTTVSPRSHDPLGPGP